MEVWFRNTAVFMSSYFDFITVYRESISLDELMQKKIILHTLSLTTNSAYLVEFEDGDNPYNTRKYPLLQLAQKNYTKYVYIVPLDDFMNYCDSFDFASRHVVYLSHSARCGSTLWSQIFNALPGWEVVCENMFLEHLLTNERPFGNAVEFSQSEQFSKMAVLGFKFHISRLRENQSVLFKMTNQDVHLQIPVYRYFKNMTVLHAYRNALPSAKSWYNSLDGFDRILPMQKTHERMNMPACRSEYIVKEFFDLYTQSYPEWTAFVDKMKPRNLFEWFLLLWCSFNHGVRLAEEEGIKVKYVKYEDFQENKETCIRKVFNYLGVDPSFVPLAMDATKADSQTGTVIAHEERKQNRHWIRTEESVNRCNQILEFMRFPDLDADFVFENTL